MNGASLSFVISLAGIISMMSIKLVEVKTGRRSILSRASERTNHIVHDLVAKVRKFLSYINLRNAKLLLHFLAYHAFVFVHKTYLRVKTMVKDHLKKRPESFLNTVIGKGVVKKKGSVSLLLKKLR